MSYFLTSKLYSNLEIVRSNRAVYETLGCFHYRKGPLGPTTDIFAITDKHPLRRSIGPAVGVIVYRPPVANLAVRNDVTCGFFGGLDRASGLALLNEHVRCISRVIIEPRYRGLGLASWLVSETMPRVGAAMVEAVSVMGKFHPFFERAEMKAFEMTADVKTERMATALEAVGIDRRLWIDSEAVYASIERLDAQRREFLLYEMGCFLQKFGSQREMEHCVERTDFLLGKLTPPGRYFAWLNPERRIPGLRLGGDDYHEGHEEHEGKKIGTTDEH